MIHLFLAAAVTLAPEAGVVDLPQGPERPRTQAAQRAPTRTPDPVADAYYQFLLGRQLADAGDLEGAVKALTRAGDLDPESADIPAEIAELYARESRVREAIQWAETALKKDPDHADAHRVLGMIYADLASREEAGAATSPSGSDFQTQAVDHLERALKQSDGDTAAAMRVMLARLYLRASSYDKAIGTLKQLLADNPWMPQGVSLLAQAYTRAGRSAEAIALLKDAVTMEPSFYQTLGETYETDKRFAEAAEAFEKALDLNPADAELKTRLAFCLLSLDDPASRARARDLLIEVTKRNPTQGWALYLLSRAQRSLGDLDAAEATARRLLAINPASTSGAHALAQVLEARREWAKLVTALEPVAKNATKGREADLALVLTHLGFAYIELGRYADATSAFERAIVLDPPDADLKRYLVQALLHAKQYDRALKLAREQRAASAGDARLARLEADALRGLGRFDEGAAILRKLADSAAADSTPMQLLAEYYAADRRYADAAAVLKTALTKEPDDLGLQFQFGAMLERQRQYADAENVFRRILAKEPQHAPTLNYLGYTLVERGTHLDEALGLIKKAVDLDPYNGAYLDSLGWAQMKLNRLDLAEQPLRTAAEQLPRDSVVQDHWGEFLARKGRYGEAVEAWRRALAGDGEQIDRAQIERKIREAASKSGKE